MRQAKHFKNTSWQMQDAGAHFSEVIRKAAQEGDQFIENPEGDVVVMLSKSRYDELLTCSHSLLDFFYSASCELLDLEMERGLDLSMHCDL